MEDNKELELLREFFNNVNEDGCDDEYLKIKNKILEIQKQNRLKGKIEQFRSLISGSWIGNERFNEILKELGYEH